MICKRCAGGDHCNDPGCMCGHRPRAEGLGLTPPSRAVAGVQGTGGAVPDAPDPGDPAPASDGRLADLLRRWTQNREASGS